MEESRISTYTNFPLSISALSEENASSAFILAKKEILLLPFKKHLKYKTTTFRKEKHLVA